MQKVNGYKTCEDKRGQSFMFVIGDFIFSWKESSLWK